MQFGCHLPSSMAFKLSLHNVIQNGYQCGGRCSLILESSPLVVGPKTCPRQPYVTWNVYRRDNVTRKRMGMW